MKSNDLKSKTVFTSQEIIDAIRCLAMDDKNEVDEAMALRIWTYPTVSEMDAIWEIVTQCGVFSAASFLWAEKGEAWWENFCGKEITGNE